MRTAKVSLLIAALLLFTQAGAAYNDTEYARFFVTKKCHYCDLYKANFYGANLTNADFTGSNLILTNFQNATLYGVIFDKATLTGANFTGAIWTDGSVCMEGSYGRCIKKKKD